MKENKNLIHSCAKRFAHFCTLTFSAENVMGKGIRSAFRHIVGRASSYRASDEHPMSTRSASDGITRRTRLVPHIAAVFMLLFFVGVGNAWAGYYKGRAVANVDGLSEEKKATVKVLATQTYYSVEGQWLEDSNISSTISTTEALNDDYWGSIYYNYYVHATSSEGAYFEGWYSDAACTEFVSADNPFWAYKSEWSSSYDGFSSSENDEDAPITTLYAKFISTPPTTYYAKVNFTTNIEEAGAFSLDSWSNDNAYIQSIRENYDTYTEPNFTKAENYVKLFVKRGYRFVDWSLLPGVNDQMTFATVEGWVETTIYTKDHNPTYFNITTTNTDPDYAGASVRANLEALTAHTLTLQKAKNRGTVTISCQNYIENSSHDGLEMGDVEGFEGLALADKEQNYSIYSSDALVLTASAADGYTFQGWYVVEEGKNTLVSAETELNLSGLDTDATYLAYFNTPEVDDPVFKVGTISCNTLEDAIQASNSSKTILLCKNYEVPAGNYTIPTGVTLLIPKSAEQLVPEGNILSRTHTDNVTPSVYRTLTLEDGAILNVNGTIEVGGSQNIKGQGVAGVGHPHGGYGRLVMEPGSHIILNNGSKLYAWGFVTGDGSTDDEGNYLSGDIDVRRNAEVHEQFQMMDWKGGSITGSMINDPDNPLFGIQNPAKVFPINQYFIQNVEVPATYRPGSRLITATGVYAGGSDVLANNVQIIGVYYGNNDPRNDVAMFLMEQTDDSEDTWVRKSYDVKNDMQVYEVNNSAHLGSITIALAAGSTKYTMMSKLYVLPITNNMKIHLLNGNMDITQNTVLLAGAELEIDKQCTFTVSEGDSLYLYDAAQWDNFAFDGYVAHQVLYTPTYGGQPKKRAYAGYDKNHKGDVTKITDASINVHGTLEVRGALYTTEGGANLYSSIADAGTVKFIANAAAPTNVYQRKETGDIYIAASSTSAQLKNENSTFTPTVGTTATKDAPVSFCFIDFDEDGNGEWKSLTTSDCFTYDENNVWYIKPGAYVPISQGDAPVEEADHTYRDGTGKIYILAADGNCQWWEVERVAGHPELFKCKHPNNHTFYYYDEEAYNWLEKKFKVSWVNWDGTPVKYTNAEDEEVNYYYVTYGTVPQWLSDNPTHVDDASHTYSFSGWLPTPAPVTEDVTYVAQYTENDRMYAITFNDEGDELIQLVYCKLGEIPECTKYDAAANNKVWKTVGGEAIGAVAGNTTYKLYAKETKANYTIRFVNWNGTELQSGSVTAGQMPSAPANPTKASDDLHSYTFKAWNPALAAATADATYTATYTSGSKTYTVTWKNGDTTLDTDELAYGETPAYAGATPTKAPDEYTYTFSGWSPAIAAVTGDATYTAQFVKGLNVTTSDKEIDDDADFNAITITTGGALTIAANTTVTTDQLILKGSADNSGQLIATANKAKINAANAYYDLYLNTDARHWRAFGVPWVVSLDATPLTEVESGRTLVLGRDYDIIWYNTAKRASQGAGAHCWEYVEHNAHILQPGQGYMIAFTSHVNTIRFAKATGTPVLFTGTVNVSGAGSGVDQGINAIANPMAYHANMNIAGVGQVHDGGLIGEDDYTPVTIANMNYIVGKTVYVQVESDQTITPTSGISPAAAPVRRAAKATDKQYMVLEDYYTIALTSTNGEEKKLYVLPEEDKEDQYIIGHDLSKFGMSTKKPQIWVKRYGVNLGLNTTAPINDVAEFPVNLYVPAAGEYTLSLAAQPNDDYIVYLTLNGEAIWNLSSSEYAVELATGTNKSYGLRLSARKSPSVATGVDEAVVDAKGETRKVLINNQVFIIRGDQVYSIDGQLVK